MRVLLKRAALVAASVVFAILLAEGVIRLLHLSPASGVVTVTEAEFSRVPGIYSPGQDLIERSIRQLPYHVVIDSLGYRGADFPRRRPEGETRILMVGDSFTFGEFVSEEATLPFQLEALLRPECPSLRVINAGLPGSTITDQHEMLRRGLEMGPNIIVLVMNTNDIKDLMAETMWPRLAENRAAKSHFPLSVAYPVLRHMALFNLLQRARAVMFNRQAAANQVARAPGVPDTVREQPARLWYERELLSIRDTLIALHIPFEYVLVPDHLLVSGKRYNPYIDWELNAAKSAGIDALDLVPEFRASGLPIDKLYLLPWDGHTGPPGNLVAAKALQHRLEDRGLTTTCKPQPVQAGVSHGN